MRFSGVTPCGTSSLLSYHILWQQKQGGKVLKSASKIHFQLPLSTYFTKSFHLPTKEYQMLCILHEQINPFMRGEKRFFTQKSFRVGYWGKFAITLEIFTNHSHPHSSSPYIHFPFLSNLFFLNSLLNLYGVFFGMWRGKWILSNAFWRIALKHNDVAKNCIVIERIFGFFSIAQNTENISMMDWALIGKETFFLNKEIVYRYLNYFFTRAVCSGFSKMDRLSACRCDYFVQYPLYDAIVLGTIP